MMSLRDKVVIVTGASRGIGREIARVFAGEGANLVVLARGTKDLNRLAGELKEEHGAVLALPCDVTSQKRIRNVVGKTLRKFGRIDILINNAGIGIKKPIIRFTPQDWDQTLNTNLKGPYLFTQAVLPAMIKQKGGQIINIGSLAGKNPIAELAAYCASKFGLVGLSESIGLEVRNHNIRVSLLMPGSVDTAFRGKKLQPKENGHPKNALTPAEVAEACLFLAKQESFAWTSQMNIRPLVVRH